MDAICEKKRKGKEKEGGVVFRREKRQHTHDLVGKEQVQGEERSREQWRVKLTIRKSTISKIQDEGLEGGADMTLTRHISISFNFNTFC